MRYLILYKGDYQTAVAGVAVRYLSVAKALIAQGHTVSVVGRDVPVEGSGGLHYHRVQNLISLIREIRSADRVILQGGGPLMLFLLSVFAGAKRPVLLDAYAPHWLEMYCAAIQSDRLTLRQRLVFWYKVYFNYVRLVWARLFAHGIVVGTRRQCDLVRGIVSQIGDLRFDVGIHLITGGCDPLVAGKPRPQEGPLSLGWIGGLWDWFDVHPVIDAVGQVAAETGNVEISFYGVAADRAANLQSYIAQQGYPPSAFRFESWVPYENRFQTWSAHDLAIVWADATPENDYASRTRNFDCISLGLPVIQNDDSFWAELVKQYDAGAVVHAAADIAGVLRAYQKDRALLLRQSGNIQKLQDLFSWDKIAADYERAFVAESGRQNKLLAMLYLPFQLFAALVGFVFFLRLRKPARPTAGPSEGVR